MIIATTYSHLGGLETLMINKSHLWNEIQAVISSIDAMQGLASQGNKVEKSEPVLYSYKDIASQFQVHFNSLAWTEGRVDPGVAVDIKREVEEASLDPFFEFCQTDFLKKRCSVGVQFEQCPCAAKDIFARHLAFYVKDQIDVGIEILPMKSLQSQMSSGPSYYEGELYNVIRNGRGVPSVPLVIIGVEP